MAEERDFSRRTLDDLYGPAIWPMPRGGRAATTWEMIYPPRSLYKLDIDSATFLKNTMADVENGWRVGEVAFFDVTILWVVDEDGAFWFAIEEMVRRGKPTGHPNYKALAPHLPDIEKLGHPSLIRCKKGRIAGEIVFDHLATPPVWNINMESGRYSRHPGRSIQHLRHAADHFIAKGIHVTPMER